MYPPELVQPMKDDLTSVGFNQLVSPDEVDEIILVKALSVFYLKNSKTISKTNLLKQINRILEQLLNERN